MVEAVGATRHFTAVRQLRRRGPPPWELEKRLGGCSSHLSTRQCHMKSVSKPVAAIVWGGLLAGLFDITQAFIGFSLMGSTPFRILQSIARGIFGTRAREMGWTSAAIGLLCHFTVAFTAATVYYLASRKLRALVERPVLCGLVYGELVFLFMYFVVIPLSAIGPTHFNIATYITGPIGHPLLVGLPIALCVRRYAG
jgi:hypothetical protein